MCYNVKALLWSQMIRARNRERFRDVRDWQEKLKDLDVFDLYQASGFSHPKMLIYQDKDADPVPATWGLVPHWVKDNDQRVQLWNSTLNARGESIFEKPSFRDSAKSKRCLIYLDGFYESHHQDGKTFPFFIRKKDAQPFPVAALWSDWTDKQTGTKWTTFSIVTTDGNPTMARIHNNPKLEGPRMPVIFPDELADEWLNPSLNQKELTELLLPFPEEEMHFHTVDRIAGKGSRGNVPSADEQFLYPDLKLVV